LVLVLGKASDSNERLNTSNFFLWLLNYEFSDTVMMLTPNAILFAVSPKKKALLEGMEIPMNYEGP